METWLPGYLAGQSLLIQKFQDAGEDMATQQTRSTRKTGRFAFGLRAVHVDDRAAGHDHLLLVPALQSARSQSNLFASLAGRLLDAENRCLAGFTNYPYFLTDPAFFKAMGNSLKLVGWVLAISVVGGTLSRASSRSGLLWPRLRAHHGDRAFLRHADRERAGLEEHDDASGFRLLRLDLCKSVGLQPIDWFAHPPLTAVIIMVAWQWLPFATLILLTSLQSLDEEQKEAAEMDGTPPLSYFWYIVLPHLARPITVVILIETIFLLNVFAEIYVTGTGRPRRQPALPRLSIWPYCQSTSAAHRPAASSRSSSPTSLPSSWCG